MNPGYGVTMLYTDDGVAHPHYEPIPNVFIPLSDPDPRATLNRLFPASHYHELRTKYVEAFE
jgi:hypothetical protein